MSRHRPLRLSDHTQGTSDGIRPMPKGYFGTTYGPGSSVLSAVDALRLSLRSPHAARDNMTRLLAAGPHRPPLGRSRPCPPPPPPPHPPPAPRPSAASSPPPRAKHHGAQPRRSTTLPGRDRSV